MKEGYLKKNSDNKAKRIFKNKNFMIGFCVFIILFIASAGISWVLLQRTKNPSNSDGQITLSESDLKVIDIRNTYNKDKNLEEASKSYDAVIAQISDSQKKSSTLVAKSVLYFNNKDYEKALEIAKQAVEIDANSNSCQYLARVYQRLDKYTEAITYYQKAIDLIDKNDPMAESDNEDFTRAIDELNETIKENNR